MPGLTEILLAASLVMGGHEMGHELEADRQDVPMTWDNKMRWNVDTTDPKKLARIAGAGFEGQDILSGAVMGTKLEKPIRTVSALNKLGYALIPSGIRKGGTGDVRMIEQNMGKKARKVAQGSLVASAISDFLRKPGSNCGLNYGQSNRGTPMLMLQGRF